MKRTLIALLSLTILIAGCGEDKKRGAEPVNVRGGRAPTGPGVNTIGGFPCPTTTGTNPAIDNCNNGRLLNLSSGIPDLMKFLSAGIDTSTIGNIKYAMVLVQITSTSPTDLTKNHFRLIVWDDLALSGTPQPQCGKQVCSAIMVDLPGQTITSDMSVNGIFNGSNLQITFQDRFGTVTINGSVSGGSLTIPPTGLTFTNILQTQGDQLVSVSNSGTFPAVQGSFTAPSFQ
jgi:hypothetical protein